MTPPRLRHAALVTTPCLILTALAVVPSPAHAEALTTDTVAVSADTYDSSRSVTTTYGTAVDLRVGNAYSTTKMAYLRFTVPAADVGRVTAAQLVLTRTAQHLPTTTITARSVGATWTEAALTASNAPALSSVLDTQPMTALQSTVKLDITAAAQAQSTVSVALTSPATTHVATFNSREAVAATPTVVLTLSPQITTPACPISALLVPTCRVWYGDTPQAHWVQPCTQTQRLAVDEGFSGRQFDILHQYNVNGSLFPDPEAIGLAKQGGRLLSENWKPATDMTWARVAAGGADARIDAEAAYLKANWTEPFFLTIYHEPEDNVNLTAGSGMTTADYVAMYRHTVLRLRADGVTNAITVMNYMGYYRWDPMRDALYPGDDVVNWIAWDPYMYYPGATAANDFAAMVNTAHNGSLGFYDWATKTHPGKPLMLAEYGAYDNAIRTNPDGQAQFYSTIEKQLTQFPALKALVHFTMNPNDVGAGSGTQPTEMASALAAWQLLAKAPIFAGPHISYLNGHVVTQ